MKFGGWRHLKALNSCWLCFRIETAQNLPWCCMVWCFDLVCIYLWRWKRVPPVNRRLNTSCKTQHFETSCCIVINCHGNQHSIFGKKHEEQFFVFSVRKKINFEKTQGKAVFVPIILIPESCTVSWRPWRTSSALVPFPLRKLCTVPVPDVHIHVRWVREWVQSKLWLSN